eukprot:jgi/Mesvir1/7227/Mv19044-RA.1
MASASSLEVDLGSHYFLEEFDLPPHRTDADAASDSELPFAEELLCKLADAGHPALIAGGWVRDRVLGKPPGDIDIATSAGYDEIEALFDRCIRVKETLVVVLGPEDNRVAFEVSPFRGDQARVCQHNLTPEDYTVAAQEDAMHRDFTFNALFYDVRRRKGLDFCHGRRDLEEKVVRCVGEASERFAEDYLRIFRAIRFACTLGFTLARETQDAMEALAPRLASVAVERVWAELGKLAASKAPPEAFGQALEMASALGLAQFIFPPDIVAALTPSAMASARRVPPGTPCALRMAALMLHAPGVVARDPREALADLATHYKLSKKEASMVDALRSLVALLEEDPAKGIEGAAVTRFALRWARLYASPFADDCLAVYATMTRGEDEAREFLRRHRHAREHMKAAVARAANREFLVKSTTLKRLGIPPGRVMGQLMEEGEYLALAHALTEEEAVLARLRACDLWPNK